MNEQEKFKKLVMLLAEISENKDFDLDEQVTAFEDEIEKSGYGEAYFGIAKSDWKRIEIAKPEYIPYRYKNNGVIYYADYYDGMQAPFTVCEWKDDFYKLETLLKNTSDVLYQMYQNSIH